MSSPPPPDPNVLATALVHLHAGLYFQIAAFVMLIYDHILTLPDEVERMWNQKISGASILFYLNRYLTPIQFIIIIDAFQDPTWSKSNCNHFVVFEGASTAALVGICELIMIIRVYALYGRSTIILVILLCLLAAQIALSAAGLHTGFAVPLPPGITGCILTGTGPFLAAVWVAPLVTDSCIFALTLWKTHQYIRSSGRSPTIDLFLRDGAMYFCVIFGANLLNVLMYFLATNDLKAIGASFSQLITSVMISRLVLNLRSLSESKSDSISYSMLGRPGGIYFRKVYSDTSFLSMTIGNLGEEFQSSSERSSDST